MHLSVPLGCMVRWRVVLVTMTNWLDSGDGGGGGGVDTMNVLRPPFGDPSVRVFRFVG